MGIYIKGMEMPKSCGECLDIGWHYVFECRLDDVEEGERLPNCPLVPVPPHGRLIEWVSAKERLPEVGKPVLCACRANIYEVMKMRTDGAWVHNDTVYDSTYMSGFVTHWMPLPQPPKEET